MDAFALLAAALAQDPHPWVRESVARWPDLPPEILDQLARDPDPDVRAAALGPRRPLPRRLEPKKE